MKHEKTRIFLTASALAATTSLGAAWCFITGFQLPVEEPVRLALVCGAVAVVCAALFPRRHGKLMVLCVAALAAGYLWHRGILWEQTKRLIDLVSRVYDLAYDWGATSLSGQGTGWVDGPLMVWGCITGMGVCYALCCRKNSLWGLLPGGGMLALCLVVTDTVPEALPLFAFLTGALLLLLTGSVRKESAGQGSRLVVRAAVPVCLFLLALYLLVPIKGYENRSEQIRERLSELAEGLPEQVKNAAQEAVSHRISSEERVDLKALGPQGSQKLPVMEVLAQYGGNLYLRDRDYDRYTGTDWESTESRQESLGGAGESVETVGLRTLTGSLEDIYLPCFPEGTFALTGGRLENGDHLRVYEVGRCMFAAKSGSPDDRYLRLPEETAAGASVLLEENGLLDAGPWSIAEFVRNRAVYDRDTGAMPSGETDFALWFLESAETGYCVHFATGATVLLRAAGIPARYVTGYLAEPKAGEWTTVTLDQAHAWVEFYNADTGRWEILDATPAAQETAEPETAAAQTPEQQTWETGETVPRLTEETVEPTENRTEKADLRWLIPVGKTALILALAAGSLVLQRLIRLYIRKRRLARLDGRGRCLALWQEAEKMAKLLGEKPPEALLAIAEKASFSQHMLTQEELVPMETYLRRCRTKLRRAAWYRRAVYRWVYGVI